MNFIQYSGDYPLLRLMICAVGLAFIMVGLVCWLTDRRDALDREDDL